MDRPALGSIKATRLAGGHSLLQYGSGGHRGHHASRLIEICLSIADAGSEIGGLFGTGAAA